MRTVQTIGVPEGPSPDGRRRDRRRAEVAYGTGRRRRRPRAQGVALARYARRAPDLLQVLLDIRQHAERQHRPRDRRADGRACEPRRRRAHHRHAGVSGQRPHGLQRPSLRRPRVAERKRHAESSADADARCQSRARVAGAIAPARRPRRPSRRARRRRRDPRAARGARAATASAWRSSMRSRTKTFVVLRRRSPSGRSSRPVRDSQSGFPRTSASSPSDRASALPRPRGPARDRRRQLLDGDAAPGACIRRAWRARLRNRPAAARQRRRGRAKRSHGRRASPRTRRCSCSRPRMRTRSLQCSRGSVSNGPVRSSSVRSLRSLAASSSRASASSSSRAARRRAPASRRYASRRCASGRRSIPVCRGAMPSRRVGRRPSSCAQVGQLRRRRFLHRAFAVLR